MKVHGKLLSDKKDIIYQVQTTYPDITGDGPFRAYKPTAFIHRSVLKGLGDRSIGEDKLLVRTHRDLFEEDGKFIGYEAMDFKTPEKAFAAADVIAKHCRLFNGYSGQEEWREEYRGKIETRVVLISSRITQHVIERVKPG